MRIWPRFVAFAFLSTRLLCSGHDAVATTLWQINGLPLCTADQYQETPAIAPDGSGGAIVAWVDNRDNDSDIYAQRIDASGAVLWTSNGVPVCMALSTQQAPHIVSDGAGGAIVTWEDFRNGIDFDIFAQRINGSGVVQWANNGVPVCTALNEQSMPVVVADGAGGEFLAWYDVRNAETSYADIYAQRINAAGIPLWTNNGIALCTATFDQLWPDITSDGAGGIIVVWSDNRLSIDYQYPTGDVFVQRVNGAGVPQWTSDGVPVCIAPYDQTLPILTTDGAGGALITWSDGRSGFGDDIYAQRINGSGAPVWAVDGIALCSAPRVQSVRAIVADGTGGAVVSWNDFRVVGTTDLYAQRVNGTGVAQWAANGVVVSAAPGQQTSPVMLAGPSGDEIVVWTDTRNGNSDVYAQHLDPSGVSGWTPDGVPVVTASGDQVYPASISDGHGGAIVTWEDFRGGDNPDIYAVRIGPTGAIPTGVNGPAPSPQLTALNHPNPFSAGTIIDVTLSHEAPVDIEIFDAAGRRVRSMDEGRFPAGESKISFDGRDGTAHALANGVYFYRVHAGSQMVTRKMVIAR